MTVIYGILLVAKGEVKKIKLRDTTETGPLTEDSLQTILKKKTPVEELGTYSWNHKTLTLFGYTKGKKGTENKHTLPEPLDEESYFSDILVVACNEDDDWSSPVSFTTEQYEKFYQSAMGMGGDDDDDSLTSESDDEKEKDEEKEEKEDDEEEVETSKKKKSALEDGVPEDEEEEKEDDEDDVEDDEGEEEAEEEDLGGDDGGEGGEDEEEAAPVKKAAAKKKPSKAALAAQQMGYAKQQLFLQKYPDLLEYTEPIPIANTDGIEKTGRTQVLNYLKTKFADTFSDEELLQFELAICQSAFLDAKARQVFCRFENPLFPCVYGMAFRRLVRNIQDTTSKTKTLLEKLKCGDLTFEMLGTMSSMDLKPELYTDLRDRMLLREKQQLEGNKALATDQYKCGRCYKRECTFYELQTRSADEPMTKFITCLNCGNHWRK